MPKAAPQSIDTGISTYFYEGMSNRLCACREYFYRFSSVIIHPYWKFAAVTIFRYVSGVLPVFIIVINKKTITVSRLIYPFDTTYHGILLEIVKNCVLKPMGESLEVNLRTTY